MPEWRGRWRDLKNDARTVKRKEEEEVTVRFSNSLSAFYEKSGIEIDSEAVM